MNSVCSQIKRLEDGWVQGSELLKVYKSECDSLRSNIDTLMN